MPSIMVPKTRAETPIGGGDRKFPEGDWKGKIEEVRIRSFPDWIDPSAGRGYASATGEIVSIQLGSNVALEAGQEDAGNQKHFVDFVTRDGQVSVEAGPDIPEASWQMQRSAALLANLAIALGETNEVEFEGEVMVETAEGFLDTLREGGYNDRDIGFSTYHRNWTSKTDPSKTGTEVVTSAFFVAV